VSEHAAGGTQLPARPAPLLTDVLLSLILSYKNREALWCPASQVNGQDVTEMTKDVQRLLVGAALRRHRERLGLRIDDAARVLRCDSSKISRIETGQRGIRWLDLQALLAEYGVREQERAALTLIADPVRAHGWWNDYADVLSSAARDFLPLETMASTMLLYDAARVPELLQTPGYTRAIVELGLALPGAGTPDRIADMRLARQQAIIGTRRPELTVVIGEAALCRTVGGAEVMHEQLHWLAEVGESYPWVTLQVLPLPSVAHIMMVASSLAILRFTGAADLGVVYLPAMSADVCVVEPADVATYIAAFEQVKTAALDPSASAQMLRYFAGEVERA
jgi:transcriptional regulator with XRE-family HTH domain